jgi:hypothetical protein
MYIGWLVLDLFVAPLMRMKELVDAAYTAKHPCYGILLGYGLLYFRP